MKFYRSLPPKQRQVLKALVCTDIVLFLATVGAMGRSVLSIVLSVVLIYIAGAALYWNELRAAIGWCYRRLDGDRN